MVGVPELKVLEGVINKLDTMIVSLEAVKDLWGDVIVPSGRAFMSPRLRQQIIERNKRKMSDAISAMKFVKQRIEFELRRGTSPNLILESLWAWVYDHEKDPNEFIAEAAQVLAKMLRMGGWYAKMARR